MSAHIRSTLFAVTALTSSLAHAHLGQSVTSSGGSDGPVTIYYPTLAPEAAVVRGRLTLSLAAEADPEPGNRHLVVISHGSGGSPWVHADLARALVDAGFTVALPEHHADNYRDGSNPGPDSWTLRPGEVSRALDAMAHDGRFRGLNLARAGLYGMSAGGHTALSLAGGQWSPARFKTHCEQSLAEDFQSCVGLAARLSGGWLDGIKKRIALMVIRRRFDDARLRHDRDARIAAIVAAVPSAADFDLDSLRVPTVPLAIVGASEDRWLVPRFHSERVLSVCAGCVRLEVLPGGHGAPLSPLPHLTGLLGDLLNDPKGYDRERFTRETNDKVTAFFVAQLLP
jgi:predicted dienelactone hydrolase